MLRAVSYNLTTLRSSVHFMHQTLKTQWKAKSNELITLWQMFDDVVSYEEDPSGTTAGIAAISTKFNDEWKAYEAGRRTIGQATKGRLKVYASRCEKILKTLFLYYIAKMQPNGLSVEEIMNSRHGVGGPRQGTRRPTPRTTSTTTKSSRGTGEGGAPGQEGRQELRLRRPKAAAIDVKELFQKARSQAEGHQVQQRDAWNQLLGLDGWEIKTSLLTMDLAREHKSIFRGIAPAEQKDIEVEWHGRTIKGRVYMRDLLDIASKGQALPPLNTRRHRPRFRRLHQQPALRRQGDRTRQEGRRTPASCSGRPTQLTTQEQDRLLDFAAYRELVKEYQHKDTEDAKEVMQWVANRLRDEIGSIAKIVTDSYARGQISAADHGQHVIQLPGRTTGDPDAARRPGARRRVRLGRSISTPRPRSTTPRRSRSSTASSRPATSPRALSPPSSPAPPTTTATPWGS